MNKDQHCYVLGLLDNINGHNEEEELICSGSKAKIKLGLADILCKQSILLESSFVQQSTTVTAKNNNSHGNRNSILIK